jgi:hypothetical protein
LRCKRSHCDSCRQRDRSATFDTVDKVFVPDRDRRRGLGDVLRQRTGTTANGRAGPERKPSHCYGNCKRKRESPPAAVAAGAQRTLGLLAAVPASLLATRLLLESHVIEVTALRQQGSPVPSARASARFNDAHQQALVRTGQHPCVRLTREPVMSRRLRVSPGA